MKILMIIGQDICINSNTNIFKRRLIKELSKEHELTILMDYTDDCKNSFKVKREVINKIEYISYPSDFKLISLLKHIRSKNIKNKNSNDQSSSEKKESNYAHKLFQKYIELVHPIYRYNTKWLKRAFAFNSKEKYDLLISISHPPVSHQLAYNLISHKHIYCNKWIQLWFEYWYLKPKSNKESKLLNKYEEVLLSKADYVFYSNKILEDYYSRKYLQFSNKIRYFDLPSEPNYLYKKLNSLSEFVIGYFGTYDSHIRNIIPLYEAFKKIDSISYIVGPSDMQLKKDKSVTIINKKLPLDDCNRLEEQCHCLVILSNHHNNMPSGKLYTYGMIGKPILFILDGTKEDKDNITNIFKEYNNFYFCENTTEDILKCLDKIIMDLIKGIKYNPIEQFETRNVIKHILNEVKIC